MKKVEDLWVMSYGSVSQRELIKSICFEKCGKVLVGEIHVLGTVLIPCNQTECEHTEDTLGLGEYAMNDGMKNLIVRKLQKAEPVEIVQEPQGPGEIKTCRRETSCGHH